MSWTPEKETKLRELWKKGHTGSEIANILGGTTRNAVIGKAHRLNLPARSVSKRSTTKTSNEKINTPEIKGQKLGRKARFRALLLDENFEAIITLYLGSQLSRSQFVRFQELRVLLILQGPQLCFDLLY